MTTVLVTRPQHQAAPLCALLERRGFGVERLPLLEIIPRILTEEALQALLLPPKIDWIIFVSTNAVNFALKGDNNGRIRSICATAKVAAIGQATATALLAEDVTVALVPEQGFNSEALLATAAFQHTQGCRCLIIRGVGGRDLLAETLSARGAMVEYLDVYERLQAMHDPLKMQRLLKLQMLDVITISSAEALQHLLALVAERYRQLLLVIPLVVISERLRLIAHSLGFTRIIVSHGVSDMDVFNTIINLDSGEYSG